MKYAMITGATVGQGNLLAKRLSTQGWHVFAGVLPGAKTDLVNGPNLTVVEQDVSNTESVKRSAEVVDKALAGKGLDLLMNVAGVANIAVGVIEAADIDQAHRLFEINMWGQLRVVQAFLPMVRRAKPAGRIANYSSGAIIANPVGAGIYNMSKHAIHGMTLTMRHELAPFGIQVTSIVPGGVLTGMSANSHANTRSTWNQQPAEILKAYKSLEHTVTQVLPDMLEAKGATPEQALEDTMKILAQPKWKPICYLGADVKPMGLMRRLFSDSQLESMMRSAFKVPSKIEAYKA